MCLLKAIVLKKKILLGVCLLFEETIKSKCLTSWDAAVQASEGLTTPNPNLLTSKRRVIISKHQKFYCQ